MDEKKTLRERIGERLEANYNATIAGVPCLMLGPGQSLMDIILTPEEKAGMFAAFNKMMMDKIVKMIEDDPELLKAVTKQDG